MRKGFTTIFLAAVFIGALPLPVRALVLDWDSVAWTNGPLASTGVTSNSYDLNGDSIFDITITLTGHNPALGGTSTNVFQNSTFPLIDSVLTGGQTGKSLHMQLDLPNKTSYVTVTMNFLNPAGAGNLAFSLFDVDASGVPTGTISWQDQIRNIQAFYGATPVSPTVTVASAATSASGGTYTGVASVANNSGSANLNFSSLGPVTSISFDYGSGPSAQNNPDNQGVGIGDISFNNISGVPEVDTVLVALGALLLAGFIHSRRQDRGNPLRASLTVE